MTRYDLCSRDSIQALDDGRSGATMSLMLAGDLRTYQLTSTANLRNNRPAEKAVTFSESADHATVRTGNLMFDGLYAMAIHEARQNSVSQIKNDAYGNGDSIELEAFETGEFWTYVWTRDLAYSVHLALAGFDPRRAASSLLFKTSVVKPAIEGGYRNQIVQDTGSGGSYPVSSDRVVWALGAHETLKFLSTDDREAFLQRIYPILRDTIEQDRQLIFDAGAGLYRGEQSFLDWREQSYPGWTKDNVLPIAMSKTLSVNAANYFLLKTAAEYAGKLGHANEESRYANWAADLKRSINERFFDAQSGLYSTYLLSDGMYDIRVHRYDLLGESLAILLGIAEESRSDAILQNYPVGPYGPPVLWPQERTVPIYHNQAIWPFVTAYWTKAARQANNFQAVDQGIRSLEHLAAFNLSNMENFDFVSGLPEVKDRSLNGPVINSRRQLWSVAGYLSMVQDVVFGLETSWDGIRFWPFVTAQLRNDDFSGTDVIELRNFNYRGSRIGVRVHLPPTSCATAGVCPVSRIEVNGKAIDRSFVPRASLLDSNQWDIYLAAPEAAGHQAPPRQVDVNDERAVFGPAQPLWNQSPIRVVDGKLSLHYHHDDVANVAFNIYRDGLLCASAVREMNWTDPASGDYLQCSCSYAIEAVDILTGNASHLTPPCCFCSHEQEQRLIPADDMGHPGKTLSADLVTAEFTVEHGGRYALRAIFSNGSGPIQTGITCAVKKLEVRDMGARKIVASGYLVMPQSGDGSRWQLSAPVLADLDAERSYTIHIRQDEVARNMSYLEHNERYTAWPGGGDAEHNHANIASIQLRMLGR